MSIYVGNTLYAVHTAGGCNPGCTDGHDMPMWHTNIVSRKSWVSTTRRLNSQFSDMEREKQLLACDIQLVYFHRLLGQFDHPIITTPL